MRSKRANVEKGQSPSALKRSTRKTPTRKTPSKYRPKVVEDEPPRPRKLTIQEPMETRSKSKTISTPNYEKNKEVTSSSSLDLSTDSEPLENLVNKTVTSILNGVEGARAGPSTQPRSMPTASHTASHTQSKNLEDEEAAGAPPGFNSRPLLQGHENQRYKELFATRPSCPVVSVDLPELRDSLGLDLYGYLEHYQKWLQIKLSYSPSVVRTFYSNLYMVEVRGDKEKTMQTRLESTVRGQKVELSPSIINTYLGYEDEDFDEPVEYTEDQILQIIKPVKRTKKFSGMSLRNDHRILWYIYTRSFVNKAQNFHHFNTRDFNILACLISGVKLNIGELIFSEISRYRQSSSKTTPMPYPQLISLFLKVNNIWYLEDDKEKITKFGAAQLNKMQITLPLKESEQPAAKKRRVEPETSRVDEAHSSRGVSPSPSLFGASIKEQIQAALQPVIDHLLQSHRHMIEEVKSQVRAVVGGLDDNFNKLSGFQAEVATHLKEIRHRLDCLETLVTGSPLTTTPVKPSHFQSSQPRPPPSQPAPPPTSPTLFTIPDPSTSSPINITFDPSHVDPQPTPISAAHPDSGSSGHTEQFSNQDNQEDPSPTPSHHHSPSDSFHTPSDPSTALVVYGSIPPPPAPQRSIPSISSPTATDDAKKGEK